MLEAERPYFLTNSEWYYFDEEEFRYKLTEKAPEEAKKSYKEFYENLNYEELDYEQP